MNKKIYVSQLFEDDKIIQMLNNNDIGIEIIEFGIGDILDKKDKALEDYMGRIGCFIENKSISIHGPFLDLNPASFDNLIRKTTLFRYNEAYNIAKILKADRIVFHSCYLDSVYFKDAYVNNSIKFWNEFFQDKDDDIKVHIENVYDKEPSHLIDIIDKVNHKSFSLCLDIGHVNCYGEEDLERWIVKLGRKIGHVHLHNNNGLKDTHSGLQRGSINIKNILDFIDNYCDNPSMTIEVNNIDEIDNSISLLANRYTESKKEVAK